MVSKRGAVPIQNRSPHLFSGRPVLRGETRVYVVQEHTEPTPPQLLCLISHRECDTMLKLINQGNVSIIPRIICRRLIALRSSTREASFNRSELKKRLTESTEKNLKRVHHW